MEIVNGYVCRNCTDVANAKKGVDPAHPKAAAKAGDQSSDRGPAVTVSGQLAQQAGGPSQVEAVRPAAYVPGASVSVKA